MIALTTKLKDLFARITDSTTAGVRERALSVAMGGMARYLAPSDRFVGTDLERLSDRVLTYRWEWYRSIVIETDEGLVLTDPFNRRAAEGLKAELAAAGITAPVHTMIYSHYHLDHAQGGEVLSPQRVVAHEGCPEYWNDLRDDDILPADLLLRGDHPLEVGGVDIRLLDLGKTHTDTLFAVHLPDERLLWTADFGLVKTIPPMGGPDYYFPGALRAMDRLAALDFDTFVPSHFDYGTKADFDEFVTFTNDIQDQGRALLDRFDGIPNSRRDLRQGFDEFYGQLRSRYRDWHGFDEMALFAITRAIVGQHLGY